MSRRVLVVDDDREMVRTLCDVLRLRGWQPEQAHSGEEALELSSAEEFALVLMDIKMPGIDGVMACQEMKRRSPDLRVVLMTAHTADDAMAKAEREGAWRVVRKPLDLPALFALLG